MRSKAIALVTCALVLSPTVTLPQRAAAAPPPGPLPAGSTILSQPPSAAQLPDIASSRAGADVLGVSSTAAILPSVRPVALRTMTLDKPDFEIPALIAYHPQFDRYYGSAAGLTSNPGYVWSGTGALIQQIAPINVDGRNFYYNPNTNAVECAPFGSIINGLFQMGLNGAGFFTGSNTKPLATMPGSPDAQAGGAYDPLRNVIYSRGGTATVSILNRATGALAGTIVLDVAAAGSPTLQYGMISYEPLFDRLIVLDTNNDRALVFLIDGSYAGASQLEPFTTGNPYVCFGYANGQAFVYDSPSQKVRAYSVFSKEPEISAIEDVGNDQGRQVRITFARSPLDVVNSGVPVVSYEIFRRVEPGLAPVAGASPVLDESRGPGARPNAVQLAGWDDVASVPAFGDAEYSVVVPTLADSNDTGTHRTTFLVRALTATPGVYFQSPADSGYSVDNLAPAPPAPFTGAYAAGATHLHWGASPEADFFAYRLYRGDNGGFTPGPGNLVTAQSDTGYSDPGPAGSYYKLAAVDFNGNQSLFATLGPAGTVDVGSGVTASFALHPIRPNPSLGGPMTVEFVLPEAGTATLELLDVAGRRVLEREVRSLGVGRHEVRLASAARLQPGLYLVRLTQGTRVRSERVAVIR